MLSDDRHNGISPFLAALIGGIAGGLVVFFSDDKRRKKIREKMEEVMDEGIDKGYDMKDKIDESIDRGKKNLAKKMRETQERLEKV